MCKWYFQTSESVQTWCRTWLPIDIHVFGVSGPYGNPYGSKIAIIWLFSTIFWPFRSLFWLLWPHLCIKLAPSAPKPSSYIGLLMRYLFCHFQAPIQGSRGPKNGYFMAKSRPKGQGWLQAGLVHLESVRCAISHPKPWESITWGHFHHFQAPIQGSRGPKMAILWLNPGPNGRGGSRLSRPTWKVPERQTTWETPI